MVTQTQLSALGTEVKPLMAQKLEGKEGKGHFKGLGRHRVRGWAIDKTMGKSETVVAYLSGE